MSQALDEHYLQWLYRQIASVRAKSPSRTYWSLARQLYSKEFVWFIPNDDNRVQDGKDLRAIFIEEERIEDPDPNWMELGCSTLEMLVALSKWLAFEAEGQPLDWFWVMLNNLGLGNCSDANYPACSEVVDDVLDVMIWRRYAADGKGGLFPLSSPRENQRGVEIWYQLNAYLNELD